MTQDAPEKNEPTHGAATEDLAAVLKSVETFAPLIKGFLGASAGKGETPPLPTDAVERREALLCALKPYFSPSRAAAADYLLRIWRVGDAIRSIQKGGE